MEVTTLIIPAFIAGLLTFLAPCTLPLVPGFLGFISGVSAEDLKNGNIGSLARKQVVKNALFYIFGFSTVFILLGTVFAFGGAKLAGQRILLARIGGVFIIFFGLYLMGAFKKIQAFRFLSSEKKFHPARILKPGTPASSMIFGMTFALGWSPCVGPILGSILVLASTSGTVLQGTMLLTIFSLGLGLPFLVVALGISHAMEYIKKISKYLHIVSIIGGVFLVFLGILLVTDRLVLWSAMFYDLFDFIGYERLLDHL